MLLYVVSGHLFKWIEEEKRWMRRATVYGVYNSFKLARKVRDEIRVRGDSAHVDRYYLQMDEISEDGVNG